MAAVLMSLFRTSDPRERVEARWRRTRRELAEWHRPSSSPASLLPSNSTNTTGFKLSIVVFFTQDDKIPVDIVESLMLSAADSDGDIEIILSECQDCTQRQPQRQQKHEAMNPKEIRDEKNAKIDEATERDRLIQALESTYSSSSSRLVVVHGGYSPAECKNTAARRATGDCILFLPQNSTISSASMRAFKNVQLEASSFCFLWFSIAFSSTSVLSPATTSILTDMGRIIVQVIFNIIILPILSRIVDRTRWTCSCDGLLIRKDTFFELGCIPQLRVRGEYDFLVKLRATTNQISIPLSTSQSGSSLFLLFRFIFSIFFYFFSSKSPTMTRLLPSFSSFFTLRSMYNQISELLYFAVIWLGCYAGISDDRLTQFDQQVSKLPRPLLESSSW